MPGPLVRALLVLSITMIVNWGILFYSLALLAPRIAAETGWSDTLIFGGFSLSLLMSGLMAPAAGRGVDFYGGRAVLTLGASAGAAGFLLLGLSTAPLFYLGSWALIGAGMAGALYDPAFATLARFAGGRTRRAISILTLAGGFASTVSWPLTHLLLQTLDWRTVAFIYAGAIAFISVPLHAFGVPSDRQRPIDTAPGDTATRQNAKDVSPRRHLSSVGLFALVIAAHGFVTSSFSVHMVRVLDALGLSESDAVLAGALVGPAQVTARFVEMLFGTRLPPLGLGLVATCLLPISFALLLAMHVSTGTAIFFGLVYGAANGLITIARGVVPYALFGPAGYGRMLGLIAAPALAVKAAAPVIFAAILTGFGITATVAACLLSGLVSAAAMLILALRPSGEAREEPPR
jgi:MFS family permease